jgi:hypothetical protein
MTKYILLPYQRYEMLQGAYKGHQKDEPAHHHQEPAQRFDETPAKSRDAMRKRTTSWDTLPPPLPPPPAPPMGQQRRVIRKRSKAYKPKTERSKAYKPRTGQWLTL